MQGCIQHVSPFPPSLPPPLPSNFYNQKSFYILYTNNDLENEFFAKYIYLHTLLIEIIKVHRPLSDTSAVICTHLVLLLGFPFSSVDHLALFLRNGLLHRIGSRRTRYIYKIETGKIALAKLQSPKQISSTFYGNNSQNDF